MSDTTSGLTRRRLVTPRDRRTMLAYTNDVRRLTYVIAVLTLVAAGAALAALFLA